MDDVATLDQFAQTGSGDVFAQLVGRHVHLVYSACFRQFHDIEAADTATQAVFVLLMRHAKGLRGTKSLVPWLFNTTYHVASRLKRQKKLERWDVYVAPNEWPAIAAKFDAALAGLPSDQRDAFLLKYVANLPLREVAEALGVSDAQAGQRINRATTALRSFYEADNLSLSADTLVARVQSHAVRPAPASAAYNATLAALSPGPTAASQLADQVMTSIRRTRLMSIVTFAAMLALVAIAVPKLYSMARNLRIVTTQPTTQVAPEPVAPPTTREKPELTAQPGPQVRPVRNVDPALVAKLIDAINQANLPMVQALIEHDEALVNAKDPAGKPVVALAAEHVLRRPRESAKIAHYLIENGAATDVFIAARSGHANQVARHLIADMTLLNATDRNGLTVLQNAALIFGTSHECEEVVNMLLTRTDVKVDLWTACTYVMPKEVERALNENPQRVNEAVLGGTPLAWAARARRYGDEPVAIANMLIARGADLRSRDALNDGMTPLHHAAAWGDQTALAALLIEKGVEVNIGDDYMLSPLDHALAGNRREMAAFLEGKGGKRTTVDHVSVSAKTGRFFAIVKSGEAAQVKILLDDTPELAKSRGPTGETPMHHAALMGNIAIVDLLLADKADINAQETNKFGGTPLHWAVRGGRVEMVKHLLAKGADPKAVNDRTGQTLLHTAAKSGAGDELSAMLKTLGIDKATKDKFDKTAEAYRRR